VHLVLLVFQYSRVRRTHLMLQQLPALLELLLGKPHLDLEDLNYLEHPVHLLALNLLDFLVLLEHLLDLWSLVVLLNPAPLGLLGDQA